MKSDIEYVSVGNLTSEHLGRRAVDGSIITGINHVNGLTYISFDDEEEFSLPKDTELRLSVPAKEIPNIYVIQATDESHIFYYGTSREKALKIFSEEVLSGYRIIEMTDGKVLDQK